MAEIITKETSISEAIRLCPKAPQVFQKHGMGCAACLAATSESVEDGAKMHGTDLQVLLDELNAACELE